MTTRQAFEQWYVEHAFDLEAASIGSRDCTLQWQAWESSTEAAAKKCDDLADGNASSMAYVCAAAIRGK